MPLKYKNGYPISVDDNISYAGQFGKIVFWTDGNVADALKDENWADAIRRGVAIRFENGALLTLEDPEKDFHLEIR